MTDRCEPPEELRSKSGYHHVHCVAYGKSIWWWDGETWDQEEYAEMNPEELAEAGYLYLAPVTDFTEVARLQAENESITAANAMLVDTNATLRAEVQRLRTASAAVLTAHDRWAEIKRYGAAYNANWEPDPLDDALAGLRAALGDPT